MATTLDTRVRSFLARKRIAVARVSRHVWMHQSVGKGSSVSPAAVEFCLQRNINVIGGACPMMDGPSVDFGHTCMRWYLKWTGGLPS